MTGRRKAAPRRRYHWLFRLLGRLLPTAVLLCAAALLIAALAPRQADRPASPARTEENTTQSSPSQQEHTLPPISAEPAPVEPLPAESWELLLVNRWNPLPEDYSIQTAA